MDCRRIFLVLALARVLLGSGSPDVPEAAVHPTLSPAAQERLVRVFILAGQSNMEGHGQIPSLDHLGDHPKYCYLLKLLKDADGSWAVRHDVTISYRAEQKKEPCGPLTVGWGASDHEIGPELMFGTIMGEHYQEQVLLVKTAWGGKDVFCDFRSPRAGPPVADEAALLEKQASGGRKREMGLYYRKMVAEIKECLAHIEDLVPGYRGQGYEIVGMAWFQGWNDLCQWSARVGDRQVGLGIIDRYSHNLAAMFRDLREDLGVPDMPIVIGELGVGGHEMTKRAADPRDREAVAMVKFRQAQKAVADDPSLKNVTFVSTLDFWDTRLQELRVMADRYQRVKREQKIPDTRDNVLPTTELTEEYWCLGGHWYCHYNGSATTYSLIGYVLAEALIPDSPSNRR
jgi:alpha-galactosidase